MSQAGSPKDRTGAAFEEKREGCAAVTRDYRTDRLNITLDDKAVVTKL
ncbi:MAG: hypothetical protein ACOH12_02080 [Parvibaculaceae bacterium]